MAWLRLRCNLITEMSVVIQKLHLFFNCRIQLKSAVVTPIRQLNYKASPFVCDLENVKVRYEVTSSSEVWRFVERILPPVTVPNPQPKDEYPSKWKPQGENLNHMPYFIPRTKNHMTPVYLKTSDRGQRRLTYVKRVQGDIWLLEKELREFIQKNQVRPIRSQVHELAQYICFNGDHVNAIKYWLMKNNL